MKNYDKYNNTWFETSDKEIDKLEVRDCIDLGCHQDNLSIIKNYFYSGFKHQGKLLDIISYVVTELPAKKDKWDNAVLLCVLLSDSSRLAKRHTNSQWLSINYN